MPRLQEHPIPDEVRLTPPVAIASRYPAPDLAVSSTARAALDGLYRETCTPAENEAATLRNIRAIAAAISRMCDVADETTAALGQLPAIVAELALYDTESEAGQ